MKGKKLCFGVLLLCSIIFGLSLSVCSDTNAYMINTSGIRNLNNNSYVRTTIGSVAYPINTINYNGKEWDARNLSTQVSNLRDINLCFDGTIYQYSFINFSLSAYIDDKYMPLSLFPLNNDLSLVQQNWGEYGRGDYTFFTDTVKSGCIDFGITSMGTYNASNRISITISNFSYYTINSEGLSAEDLQIIKNRLSYINGGIDNISLNTGNIKDTLDDILEKIDDTNSQEQQDRDNIESQQSDSQSGADDSQEAAESTGTTLLGAFTGFVGALTSASPSNCNIDMDLGNLDLGVVNLCQLSLPQPFPTIASIMLILFCVPLSIATARKVINLFRSFQG